MTEKEVHIERHRCLHEALDELVADFIIHTGPLATRRTIMELLMWSFHETLFPTEKETE